MSCTVNSLILQAARGADSYVGPTWPGYLVGTLLASGEAAFDESCYDKDLDDSIPSILGSIVS